MHTRSKKIMQLLVIIAITAMVFLLGSCTAAGAVLEEFLEGFLAIGGEPSKGLFYQVEGGENHAYLFGSVHLGKRDMYPLHDAVYEAFRDSDVLVLELDRSEMEKSETLLMEKGTYDDDRTMTDLVSEETFEEVADIMEEYGISAQQVKQFKPWYAALMLEVLPEMRAGYTPELGLENYFLEKASNRDMEVLGLESAADQIEVFERLSDQSQVLYLESKLQTIHEGVVPLDQTISYWKEGDAEFFAQVREESIEGAETSSMQAFQLGLLDERDQQMSERIQDLLHKHSDQTYFITVGALHLTGENSIVDVLEHNTYNLQQVYEANTLEP